MTKFTDQACTLKIITYLWAKPRAIDDMSDSGKPKTNKIKYQELYSFPDTWTQLLHNRQPATFFTDYFLLKHAHEILGCILWSQSITREYIYKWTQQLIEIRACVSISWAAYD